VLLVGRIVGFLVQAAGRPGYVRSVSDAAGCVNHRDEDFSSSLKAERYFRDPDGHRLELATPGLWSIILIDNPSRDAHLTL
jgi:hypothetical protein